MSAASDSDPALKGGVLAGVAGLAVFLVVHQLWIVPIWFVAPIGAVMAGLGGAAVGASYATLRPHLPGRPWTTPVFAAIVAGMLTPAVLIAELQGPVFAMGADGGGTLLVPATDVVLDFLIGLVGITALSGAIIGALVGRTRRAAVTTMVAGVALGIGPGHNIPLLGGTPGVGRELVILGVVLLTSGVVLVEAEARLFRWTRTPSTAGE
jgi:hypothetical protein